MDLEKLWRGAGATKHPTDLGLVIRGRPDQPELIYLRWGLQPGAGEEPIINVRSESASFDEKRCLVPATEFFLFTGSESPKTRWRVTLTSEDWFCFAGIWQEASEDCPESYAVITIDAAPDLAHITERQMAVMPPQQAPRWLDLETPAAELLTPLPEGSYAVDRG